MRKLLSLTAAIAVSAAVWAVPSVGAGPAFKNKYGNTTDARPCENADGEKVGTVTYTGPTKLWPPNHKYAPATVVAQSSDPQDPATLTTEASHDQPEGDSGGNGSGNTADDITPAAASQPAEDVDPGPRQQIDFKIRSERAGSIKTGRTYTIQYEATFGETTCIDEFIITVPHDMRAK